MRVLSVLALACATATAQGLPPVGTYQRDLPEARGAWPDPAKLSPSERLKWEVLLRQAHAQRAGERPYRDMPAEERQAHDEGLRRGLGATDAGTARGIAPPAR